MGEHGLGNIKFELINLGQELLLLLLICKLSLRVQGGQLSTQAILCKLLVVESSPRCDRIEYTLYSVVILIVWFMKINFMQNSTN